MTSSKRVKSPRRIGQRNTTSTERFIIITNTKETEKNYFNGLKDHYKKNKVSIEVKSVDLPELLPWARIKKNTVTPINPNVWIVFDYDQEKHFDEIIQKAENEKISVAWSNPCFEVWLWAYLDEIPYWIGNSSQCIDEFKKVFYKKTGRHYEKNNKKIYNFLEHGNEDKALNEAFKRADRMREPFTKETPPSKMAPATRVDELVKKILKK